MDHSKATALMWRCCSEKAAPNRDAIPPVPFITPVMSTILAAASVHEDTQEAVKGIRFADEAGEYARNTGLTAVLNGEPPDLSRGSREGKTYSKLTRLHTADDVDRSNVVIGDLLAEHLGDNPHAQQAIGSIVGELHDNVASHAHGAGFSAAQVYTGNNGARISFAVADRGCGLLKNVRKVNAGIDNHKDAIAWCLTKFNSTGRQNRIEMEQRLLEDAIVSPYPEGVATVADTRTHAGLGLWYLTNLIDQSQGSLWIWSGNAEYERIGLGNLRRTSRSGVVWSGLAIEISINAGAVCANKTEWKQYAARYGL
jgi:hypothetical protein